MLVLVTYNADAYRTTNLAGTFILALWALMSVWCRSTDQVVAAATVDGRVKL